MKPARSPPHGPAHRNLPDDDAHRDPAVRRSRRETKWNAELPLECLVRRQERDPPARRAGAKHFPELGPEIAHPPTLADAHSIFADEEEVRDVS